MKKTRKSILTLAALLGGVCISSATVTVQGWWHAGETGSYLQDSSGNNRHFRHAYSGCDGGGNAGGIITPNGCGGPLGTTGFGSASSVYWGGIGGRCNTGGAWNPGNTAIDPTYGTGEGIYNPPATNYVIECWLLIDPDVAGSGWFFGSGSGDFSQPNRDGGAGGGGVYFMRINDAGVVKIGAFVIGNAGQGVPADAQIGGYVNADSTRWMHVAIVNDGGTNTFYVGGVAHGAPQPTNTVPNGNIFLGSSPGTWNAFHGYIDELRMSTFAPGAFATSDLLLRPPASILVQPQPATVWDGGAAVYSLTAAYDASLTYQWQRAGVGNISGAISQDLYVPTVTIAADNGASFSCVVKAGTSSVTSSNATLTVLPVKTDDVAFYRQAVNSESTLIAYFPVDSDTGSTLSNTKDPSHNGTFEGNASYDGRTSRTFGVRSLRLKGDGDVTINPPNPAYEFASGNGTIEALVYLDPPYSALNQNLFAIGTGSYSIYYGIQVTPDGTSLIYTNDALASPLIWSMPVSILRRQAHVAVVIDHTVNVTAYVDGLSLGTKTQPSFGSASGSPANIGALTSYEPGIWNGTIDELAIYSSALSASTIAIHNSKFVNGTNVTGPTITSEPLIGSKTLLAGGSPTFTVGAAGTAPLSYKWYLGANEIPGATAATLTLPVTTTNSSGAYHVVVSNPIGSTNSQTFTLNFLPPGDAYAAKVMTDNPSAYWRMGETNGTTGFDVAGGHDGSYMKGSVGGYTLGAPSLLPNISDPAVLFSAPSFTYGGKLEVPYNPVFNGGGPFTVEAWCTPDFPGNNGWGFVVSSQLRNTGVRKGWYLAGAMNAASWDFNVSNGTAEPAATGGPDILVGVMHHVVGVYDGTNGLLYVDNVLSATLPGPLFVANPSAPLIIGAGNSTGTGANRVAFGGPIDEVAFYGYALSANQISNHYSIRFVPAAITAQPVGVTNNELSTVTLTAAASGFPNTYQWYQNGVALNSAKVSFDGTAHYPGGVTSPTLTIAKPTTADAGQYHMLAINSLGNDQTIDVTVLLIITDTTPPNVVSAASMGNASGGGAQTVDVQFDKILDLGGTDPVADPGTARNAANYTFVSPSGATVSQVELRKSGTAVRLTVTGLLPATTFTVKVANVRDWTRRASNAIPPAGQTVSGAVQTLLTATADVDTTVIGTTYTVKPGEYEAEAGGNDIWGATDQFHYGYSEVSGDFDVSAQIVQVGSPGNRSGIMLREEAYGYTTGDARFNYITWNPGNSLGFHVRETAGVTPVWKNPQQNWFSFGPTPNVWIRLKRVGTVTSAYYSTDGGNWNAFGTTTNIIADPAFLGLATCSGGGANTGLTKYANYGVTVVHPKLSVSNAGGQLTISWTETGALLQSTNVTLPAGQWTVVPGTSPYVVTPAPGTPQMYYRVRQ